MTRAAILLLSIVALLTGCVAGSTWLSSTAFAQCVSATADQVTQRIIIRNTCNQYVSWAMCVRVAGRSFDDYPVGSTAPGGSSQYGVFGKPFSYQINYCVGKGCNVTQPECVAPSTSGGGLGCAKGCETAFTQANDQCFAAAPHIAPGKVEGSPQLGQCLKSAYIIYLHCVDACYGKNAPGR